MSLCFQFSVSPTVKMYLLRRKMDKRENNLSVDHFQRELPFVPILPQYGSFSHRAVSQGERRVASELDRSRHTARCSFLKINPIWLLLRKLNGTQISQQGSAVHESVKPRLICSLQEFGSTQDTCCYCDFTLETWKTWKR